MNIHEIEVRFLNINKEQLVKKLLALHAIEIPEYHLEEIIFYDPDLKWRDIEKRFVRIRNKGGEITLTYKHKKSADIGGTEEIEFVVSDMHRAQLFVERLGLISYREQAKRRHTWKLDDAVIDIDTWPTVPPYAEIEGKSEQHLQQVSQKLGFDWSKKIIEDPLIILEKYYHIPFGKLQHFTFEHIA